MSGCPFNTLEDNKAARATYGRGTTKQPATNIIMIKGYFKVLKLSESISLPSIANKTKV